MKGASFNGESTFQRPEGLYLHCHKTRGSSPPWGATGFNAPKGSTYIVTLKNVRHLAAFKPGFNAPKGSTYIVTDGGGTLIERLNNVSTPRRALPTLSQMSEKSQKEKGRDVSTPRRALPTLSLHRQAARRRHR